jgi:uncharacterized small protein (DUF1192 family)
MDIEDLEPRKVKPKPKDLGPVSIEDLVDYIRALEAEIERAKAEIARKEAHRSAASAFFKPAR